MFAPPFESLGGQDRLTPLRRARTSASHELLITALPIELRGDMNSEKFYRFHQDRLEMVCESIARRHSSLAVIAT